MAARPGNPHSVDVRNPDDLLYWSTHFRIGTDDLVRAVEAVGGNVEDIEQHLLSRGTPAATPGSPPARR